MMCLHGKRSELMDSLEMNRVTALLYFILLELAIIQYRIRYRFPIDAWHLSTSWIEIQIKLAASSNSRRTDMWSRVTGFWSGQLSERISAHWTEPYQSVDRSPNIGWFDVSLLKADAWFGFMRAFARVLSASKSGYSAESKRTPFRRIGLGDNPLSGCVKLADKGA